ncbi:MAG TPA: hypothetical protein VH092_04775 [Urbifossiella sp.]|nr:hypothetical protein [Urbifossiella sp.]
MTIAEPCYPFDGYPPAELTPAERATAVAAILAAGLLRHRHPELFLPPAARTDSQEIPAESTC